MPNVVKGSKQERMVVVPYRPWHRLVSGAGLLAVVAVAALGGFWLGMLGVDGLRGETEQLRQRIAAYEIETASLRQEIATLDRSYAVDRQAGTELQTTIAELREYTVQLEQDIAFYRQAMTSEFEDVGLVVGQVVLQGTDDPARFRYKLVLRQEESDGQYLTGHANIKLVGRQGDARASYPLAELSADQDQLDIKLRFRYFQNIEGELQLPTGFEPERIEVSAVATAPMAKSVSRNYDWVVEGE